ncbi:MAG: InlB B-repeat-containing protein, partial [Eubacteriales bacterium]|nr:InlB B-repeat-containing protein [Eubacteriales bacterium]
KAYANFTLNESAAGTVKTGTITADGSLILKLYYDRDSFTITFDANEGTLKDAGSKTLRHGAAVTVFNPARVGYSFDGWYLEAVCINSFDGLMPSKNITVYAKWIAVSVNYTVEHYVMDTEGNYPAAPAKTDNKFGITGTELTLADLQHSGFLVENGIVYKMAKVGGNIAATAAILADGSLVVKLCYERRQHNLVWDFAGGTASGNYTQAGSVYYGAAITPPTLTRQGYNYTWNITPAAMPANDVTFTAVWTARNDTAYKVEHYLQNAGDNGYTKSDTDNLTGVTNAQATAQSKTYANFTLNESVSGTVKAETIAADGSLILKLYYDRDSFTITFDANEGTLKDAGSKTLRHGAAVAVTNPARIGHSFGGWYLEAACTNSFDGVMPSKNITVYAKWIAGQVDYTVEHYVMDTEGNYSTSPSRIDNKSGITGTELVLADLQHTGLLVENGIIYKMAKVGGNIAATAAILADGSLVVKLFYERIRHNLAWNFAGGTASGDYTNAGSVYYGAAITPPTLTRQGYNYTWNTTPAAMPASDVTYTAVWTGKSDTAFKVEHYLQNAGDNGYTKADTDNLAGVTNAQATAQSKAYANFTLNESAAGTVKTGTITADGSLILKLYYDRDSFTVTFNANEGTLKDAGSKTLRHGAAVTVTNPARIGYSFGGWFLEADCTNSFDGVMPSKNITVYAKWIAGQVGYTVEHYVMDTEGNYPAAPSRTDNKSGITGTLLILADLKNSGFILENRIVYKEAKAGGNITSIAAILADGSLVIKLYYERKAYTLSWDFGGGIANNSYTAAGQVYYDAPVTAPELSKTGYRYTWISIPVSRMPAENVSYTASWTSNTYQVSFDGNGGTGSMTNQSFTYGVSQILTGSSFTRIGYTFAGWATSASGANVYDDNESVLNLTAVNGGTVRLYAVWTRVIYGITYHLNGGTNPPGSAEGYSITESIALPTPTLSGYTFAGWYDNEGLSGTAATGITIGSTGAKTFYAKWTPATYTITYQLNGGTASGNPLSYTINSNKITLINPTKTGADFVGWSGTGLTGMTNTYVTIPAGSTGNRSYTANWRSTTYSITYFNSSGSEITEGNSNPTQYSSDEEVVLQALNVRAGEVFAGWYTGQEGTGKQIKRIPAGSTGNITLYSYVIQATPITTQDELWNMTANGKYYLANDLTLIGWEGYGYNWFESTGFDGIFFGNGHTITLGQPADTTSAGVFKKINPNGKVFGLTVTGFVQGSEYEGTGGIADINWGSIQNCSAENLIISAEGRAVGGITGINIGTTENCTVSGILIERASDAGGITGINYGVIKYDGVNGRVVDVTTRSVSCAGGITGRSRYFNDNQVTINIAENCDISVTVNIAGGGTAGGLVGEQEGASIRNLGKVTVYGSIYASSCVGGIMGYAVRPREKGYAFAEFSNFTFAGTAGSYYPNAHIGGILGLGVNMDSETFTNCTLAASAKLEGTVQTVGGIIGTGSYMSGLYQSMSFINCHVENSGSITATAALMKGNFYGNLPNVNNVSSSRCTLNGVSYSVNKYSN